MTRPRASLNWYEPGASGIVPAGGRCSIAREPTGRRACGPPLANVRTSGRAGRARPTAGRAARGPPRPPTGSGGGAHPFVEEKRGDEASGVTDLAAGDVLRGALGHDR